MSRTAVVDDLERLNVLLDRFTVAETAVKAALAVPPVPTPSAALGEALASRNRAALAVCRFLTGQGGTAGADRSLSTQRDRGGRPHRHVARPEVL